MASQLDDFCFGCATNFDYNSIVSHNSVVVVSGGGGGGGLCDS